MSTVNDKLLRQLVSAVDNKGCTALHNACYSNQIDIISTLLKLGSDVNIQTKNKSVPIDKKEKSEKGDAARLACARVLIANPCYAILYYTVLMYCFFSQQNTYIFIHESILELLLVPFLFLPLAFIPFSLSPFLLCSSTPNFLSRLSLLPFCPFPFPRVFTSLIFALPRFYSSLHSLHHRPFLFLSFSCAYLRTSFLSLLPSLLFSPLTCLPSPFFSPLSSSSLSLLLPSLLFFPLSSSPLSLRLPSLFFSPLSSSSLSLVFTRSPLASFISFMFIYPFTISSFPPFPPLKVPPKKRKRKRARLPPLPYGG